jgi:hypothetical protein
MDTLSSVTKKNQLIGDSIQIILTPLTFLGRSVSDDIMAGNNPKRCSNYRILFIILKNVFFSRTKKFVLFLFTSEASLTE